VAAPTPVNDDVDGDVGAIAGSPVGAHLTAYVISLSNCQKQVKCLMAQERGHVRCKYTQRKIVLNKITLIIWQEHSYLTTIDKLELHQIYGIGTPDRYYRWNENGAKWQMRNRQRY
jgi:hypothetical protein